MNLPGLTVFLIALVFSLVTVPVASSIASWLHLVDHPSIRKRHVGAVPLAGGMVIVVGLWISLYFLPKSPSVWATVLLSFPLFLVGVLDDKFDIPAKSRLIAQFMVGVGLLVFGVSIDHLDSLFSQSSISLNPLLSMVFTLVCTCGVLNAINMADGIDGLLGSVSSVSLLAISWLAFDAKAIPETNLALVTVGLIAGYLAYNLGMFGTGRRIFLGDSGSMVVGLILLVLLIELSQGYSPAITPTSAGWILGIPLLDTVSVMVRRITTGRSAFAAGRDHFHHVLQDLGLSRRFTLHLLVGTQVVFVLIGVVANKSTLPQYVFFWLFVFATVSQYLFISWAVRNIGNGSLTENGIITDRLKRVKN